MKRRAVSWLPWSTWTIALLALLLPIGYKATGHDSGGFGLGADVITTYAFILSFATVGAVLASKRPSNPVGWLVLASGLCFALGTLSILLGTITTRWGDWLSNWVWGLGIAIPSSLILLLFPTGKLPSKRWRPVAWLGALALALSTIGNAFAPGVMPDTHSVNPLGIGGPVGPIISALQAAFGVVLLAGLASLASLVFRYRKADPSEREQLKWLIYAAGVVLAGVVAGSVVTGALGSTAFATNVQNAIVGGTFTLVPVGIGIAVMKYRLYDIDVVINKTLVYGLLAGFITAVYVAIVVGLGALIGHRAASRPSLALSILATAVVAVAFQPVRDRVQKLANRLVYGKRATPYEVLSEFAKRMAGAVEAEEQLPRLARALAEGTGAATASVWLAGREDLRMAASWPDGDLQRSGSVPVADPPVVPDATLCLPVRHRGELLGALSLRKAAGDRLTPTEETLASDLAAQAGLVFHNVRLTQELLDRLDELQRSRQRLVAAQDEERRRLERNIHDGAQQQLVALAVKARLARTLTQKDPERSRTMISDLGAGLTTALEDLRDLARGIYPPLLADQGLEAALRAQARRAPIPVDVRADGIARYSRDAEAAVYFCTLEALQNVGKYAGASKAVIRLSQSDGHLTFEVVDDGAGFDTSRTSYGTGLQGMADRLAALGGDLEVRSSPGAGTALTGRLPMAAEPEGTQSLVAASQASASRSGPNEDLGM